MTPDAQYQMFDCSVKDLDDLIVGLRARGHEIVPHVMSMLSDIQEMQELGLEKETTRRALNRAKYLLDYERHRSS